MIWFLFPGGIATSAYLELKRVGPTESTNDWELTFHEVIRVLQYTHAMQHVLPSVLRRG